MYEITALDQQRTQEISTIPRAPFTLYSCGFKSAGKTTMLINLLTRPEFYKGVFNQVFWISPTSSLDAKLNVLRETDIMTPNRDLIKLMKRLAKEKTLKILDDEKRQEMLQLSEDDYETKMTDEHFIEDFSFDWLQDIINTNKYITTQFGKRYADKILLIFDDSIGEKIWKDRRMTKLVLNSRHVNVSMFISSQSYYLLPKTLRNNNSFLLLFENGNRKELQSIYAENNSGKLNFDEFYKLYREAVEEPFGFFCINYQNPARYRFQNQFREIFEI